MGNFRQHITASTLTGVGVGLAGAYFGVPTSSCLLAGGYCAAGGMLPDIDSDTSRSFQECIYIAAGASTMLLMNRLKSTPINPEIITLAAAGMFFFVRFGVGSLLKKMTVHRGLFHSIPAAILSGILAFLISSGSVDIRIFKAFGLFAGFMSHLILDEIYSIDLQGRRIKKSFGTALKMFNAKDLRGTVLLYAAILGLLLVATKEPGLADALELHGDQLVAAAAERAESGNSSAWWAHLLDVEDIKNAMDNGIARLKERKRQVDGNEQDEENVMNIANIANSQNNPNSAVAANATHSTPFVPLRAAAANDPANAEKLPSFVFSSSNSHSTQNTNSAIPVQSVEYQPIDDLNVSEQYWKQMQSSLATESSQGLSQAQPPLPFSSENAAVPNERIVLVPETLPQSIPQSLPLVHATGSPGVRSQAEPRQGATTEAPYSARPMIPITSISDGAASRSTGDIPTAMPGGIPSNIPKSESAPALHRAPAAILLPF